jgi:hypothetical protein
MRFELITKAIDNLTDNGFSGIMVIKNEEGKIVRRKGINGATEAEVKTIANKYFEEFVK